MYPGLDPALPLALLPHVRGLVVEAYGAGNYPMDPKLGHSLLPLFSEARERGVPVVVVSQAHRNGVDLSLYESGAAALERGALSGGDMTPSAALVKLMQGLAYYPEEGARARFIQTPIVGEMTDPTGNVGEMPAKKSRRAR